MSAISGYDFEIILGTREDFVLGYVFMFDSAVLMQSFSIRAHRGGVRTVVADTDYVASGGDDKIIKIFNMGSREIVGDIRQHVGAITCLQFTPDGSHLVSASVDGSIAMYKKGTWSVDTFWQSAHKGNGVNCISIHPKGKLILSIAHDRSLKTWNLVKGKSTNITNLSKLGKIIERVMFSKKGNYYAIPIDYQLHVFDINLAGTTCVINCASIITAALFIEDNITIFGTQDGWLICYDVVNDKSLWKLLAENSSITCLATASPDWLISVTYDGVITLWKCPSNRMKLHKVASVKSGCHITCVSVRYPPKTKFCS